VRLPPTFLGGEVERRLLLDHGSCLAGVGRQEGDNSRCEDDARPDQECALVAVGRGLSQAVAGGGVSPASGKVGIGGRVGPTSAGIGTVITACASDEPSVRAQPAQSAISMNGRIFIASVAEGFAATRADVLDDTAQSAATRSLIAFLCGADPDHIGLHCLRPLCARRLKDGVRRR
jgi:hypothetical protein